MRIVYAFTMCLFLAGCGSVAQSIQTGLTEHQLDNAIGQPYTQVTYDHPDYGHLVGRARLQNGNTIYKLVGKFGAEKSNYGGVYGTVHNEDRAIYFNVNPQGKVVDYATAFFEAGKGNCILGICNDKHTSAVPTSALDSMVKTSKGEPLSSWGRAS